MKHIHSLNPALCVVALLTFFTTLTLRAQFGNDLIVGDFESDQTTNITSGTNTHDNTYVGYDSFSSNNTLGVYNSGTLLTNSSPDPFGGSGGLYVGYEGSTGNRLVISNGGMVGAAGNGYIGYFSDDNTALVTGSGSLLTIGDPSDPFSDGGRFYVGDGNGNSLVISNGGTAAVSRISSVGFFGSNNSVLVTGTNSLWTNAIQLDVGDMETSGNRLVISNGGRVAGIIGTLGWQNTASNNTVLVTGTNSLWTNSGRTTVGSDGSGNSLVISNGGRVQNNLGFIGENATALNNSVLVTGADSTWSTQDALRIAQLGSGTLTVASGGSVAARGSITIASSNGATGTLNVGRFGTNDTGGTIIAPTIAFGAGTGVINFNQSDAVTITSRISGAGTINQLGAGTTTLTASNTYTGATTVAAGKLVVDGSIAASAVTVQSGGTLGGSGTVGGIVLNLGSTLSPGNSPGTTSVAGNVVWNAGANYNWQIYDTMLGAGTGWDLVSATGSLDLTALTVGSEFNINLWSLNEIVPNDVDGLALNFDPNQNYTWSILTASGGISGFTGSSQFLINTGAINGTAGFANALNGGTFSIVQNSNDLNLVFTSASAPIPEPGTWAAAALLAAGATFLRLRKRAKVS